MPASRIYNPFVGSGGGGGGSADAEEIKTFAFNYNDASPVTCFQIPANGRILETRIIMTVPFTNPSATLTVGDALDPDRLMLANQNIPDEVGEYVSSTYYRPLVDTDILLTISVGLETQGQGVVVVVYNLNT